MYARMKMSEEDKRLDKQKLEDKDMLIIRCDK